MLLSFYSFPTRLLGAPLFFCVYDYIKNKYSNKYKEKENTFKSFVLLSIRFRNSSR